MKSGEKLSVMNETLGDRILQLRKNAGFTQTELAEKIGVSKSQYLRYENKNVQPPPHVIMPGRFQWLIMHNDDFCKKLKPSQVTVLDTMIIGCTVGLRYKDLMALKPANLEITEICSYLSLQTSKTGTMVRIPLPAYAVAILKKYYKKGNKCLLPLLSNNQFNHQMKQIGKLAGWTEEVPKYRSIKGRQTEIKKKPVSPGVFTSIYRPIPCGVRLLPPYY